MLPRAILSPSHRRPRRTFSALRNRAVAPHPSWSRDAQRVIVARHSVELLVDIAIWSTVVAGAGVFLEIADWLRSRSR
jgi:hypothetical protein